MVAALLAGACSWGSRVAPIPPAWQARPGGADQHTVPSAGPLAAASSTVTLVGAADIASCSSNQGDEKTAAIINNLLLSDPTATVFAAGDVVYDNATAAEFTNCYRPSWGRFKATHPARAGQSRVQREPDPILQLLSGRRPEPPARGTTATTWARGTSSCSTAIGHQGGFGAESVARGRSGRHVQTLILAYWHHARFASAVNSRTPVNYKFVRPLWDALYAAKSGRGAGGPPALL